MGKLLTRYRKNCKRLNDLGHEPPHRYERLQVYSALIDRHGGEAVLRHVGEIREILDRAAVGITPEEYYEQLIANGEDPKVAAWAVDVAFGFVGPPRGP